MAVVVAVVTGDLPLVWADWLVVEAETLAVGELVGGRWPAALVMAARRPSGFVPYCTGWNNLIREKKNDKIMLFQCLEQLESISTTNMSCCMGIYR